MNETVKEWLESQVRDRGKCSDAELARRLEGKGERLGLEQWAAAVFREARDGDPAE